MLRISSHLTLSHLLPDNPVVIVALFAADIFFNIAANSSFKLSATAPTWRDFLAWQIIGNLAGFITVLTLTGLLRAGPLHIIYPVTTGLAIIGVQVVGARLLFGEAISPTQWLGTGLVVGGILLIGR